MTRLGSILFVVWFWTISFVLAVIYCVNLLLPRKAMVESIRFWARLVVFGLETLARVKVEVRGLEHCPRGAGLIAAKHECMFDFIGPFIFLPDACFVLKKELLKVPFFGWHANKTKMIPIDREGRSRALKDLVAVAQARLAEARQIIIFPEGTRVIPGATPDYKPGVAALYRDLELPCTPLATNSGVHWPAKGWPSKPGTIVFEFLPAIPPGLKRADFMREMQDRVETASNALLAQGL